MIADEIKVLEESGQLKRFVAIGIIPVKVVTFFQIYNHYKSELEINRRCNNCIMQSVTNTCDKFKVSQSWVYKAIQLMQSE